MQGDVLIREVGPRDGLQMVRTILPTQQKLDWCRLAVAAGLHAVEVTSFVPAAVIPQFADAEAVAAGALRIDGLDPSALVVNLKGTRRALEAGLRKLTYVISASEAHSAANARRSTDMAIAEYARIREEFDTLFRTGEAELAFGIATAFGCTIQGAVSTERVLRLVDAACELGAEEIMLADTVGYAHPDQVSALFVKARARAAVPLAAHFHDTRGLGLANVLAALQAGVRRFDASLSGLGGCPFAPGATGNIATEDLAYMLEAMGWKTGIDLPALLALQARIRPWLHGERMESAVVRAGLPLTMASEESH